MRTAQLLIVFTLINTFAFSREQNMPLPELPTAVIKFFTSIKNDDTNLFETIISDHITIDDWGKIFNGREKSLEFSKGHLLGQSATFDISDIKNDGTEVRIDGTWKSKNFTGPTRFIFQIRNDKIHNLVISSPRWIDRAFISIKSIF